MNNNSILISQQDMESYQLIELPHYTIGYFSARAKTKKTPNEDALLVYPTKHGLLVAVADGVGSTPRSYEASHKILQALTSIKTNLKKSADYTHAIIDAIESTNTALVKNPNNPQTTLTLCSIVSHQIKSFQVGDSGVFLCGQRAKLKYKSIMHSPVGYAVAAGILNEAEAIFHPDANLIDNAVGDPLMKIEIGPELEISRSDSLFLATDGLFDNLPANELIDIVKSGPVNESMKILTECCQQQLHPDGKTGFIKEDDMSFILCRRTN
ncbi:MAG: serine/threonine-protein phosphatase [Gammaproteobacteria bacterium]|nr:serine/threonine-protein phosphatase [Gammaproteobacteria bacterium]